ncbi:MAG: B12-binding domain-containing radical SAM protein [Desulfomonilaceae bacterium]
MRAWPLGLVCVAQALQDAGHDVYAMDLMEVSDFASALARRMEDFAPALVGISARNIDNQQMNDTKTFLGEVKAVATLCRELTRVPIVLGGAGYSICPRSILEFLGADMGISGEGEEAMVRLARDVELGLHPETVPGLHRRAAAAATPKTFQKDLDRFALPGKNFLPHSLAGDQNFWLPVQTRRGCPMRCSYCSTETIEGAAWRFRSPDVVARWLTLAAGQGFTQFYFVDNTFNLPSWYAKRLCREIIAANLKIAWRCIIYPLRLDAELVELMAAAGCKEVSLGFESGSTRVLRSMNKRFSPEDVRHTSRLFAAHGVKRIGFLLLGGPEESKETALESLRFADSLELESLRLSVGIRIYPHTRLAMIAEQRGIIPPGRDLMQPSFYVEPSLKNWLTATAEEWLSQRPHWFW